MAEESAPEAASGLHGKPARGEARPVGGRFATRKTSFEQARALNVPLSQSRDRGGLR